MEQTFHIGSVVFGSWIIAHQIGRGSFGTVYEIQREDFGQVYRAALKVITVPRVRKRFAPHWKRECPRHKRSGTFTVL